MNWLSSFIFTRPLWLALLPVSTALLVYMYRRRGVGLPLKVPTLLVLKRLALKVQARRKFIPPWRFYLELLIASIFIAALAGLTSRNAEQKIALLLDNSFSMRQVLPNSSANESAWKIAMHEARAFLQGLSVNSKIELFATSPSLRSISSGLVEPTSAISFLAGIESQNSPDFLEAALSRIIAKSEFDRIVVYTDRQLSSNSKASGVEVRSVSNQNGDVRFGNIAVSDVHARSTGEERSLEVDLSGFSNQLVKARVSLYAINRSSEPTGRKLVLTQPVLVPKMGRVSSKFSELPIEVSDFQISLDLDQASTLSGIDSIADDNQAWVSFAANSNKVLLVSDLGLRDLGLERFDLAPIEAVKPDLFLQNKDLSSFKAVIFHRYCPDAWPDNNAIFIAPQESSLFGVSKVTGSPVITSWAATNPVLSYIRVPSLVLKSAFPVSPPAWANKLINSNLGALAFNGELAGHRYLVIGFEVLPYEGKKSPILSILLLNAIKYVSGLGSGSGFVRVGTDLGNLAGEEVDLFKQNSWQNISALTGFILKDPGLYRVASRGVLAANYFDDRESDVFSPQDIIVQGESIAKPQLPESQGQPSLLIIICLCLVIFDLGIGILLGFLSRRRG